MSKTQEMVELLTKLYTLKYGCSKETAKTMAIRWVMKRYPETKVVIK